MKRLTPDMIAAWVNYEPAHDVTPPLRYAQILGAIRHAFYAGWDACDSGRHPEGEDAKRLSGEAMPERPNEDSASPNPSPPSPHD
jgi:hypothetical protein